MAGKSLRPETLRKKELAAESLEAFLARMTLVWHERQTRLAVAPEKARAASLRSARKRQLADPEGFASARRDAARRYEERHREARRERDRRIRERLSPALALAREVKQAEKAAQRAADKERKAAERGAKRASRPEGYPKDQPKRRGGLDAAHVAAVARQPDLSRAWFGPAQVQAACPDKRSSLASE